MPVPDEGKSPLPWTLKTAAVLLGTYGVATLISALVLNHFAWPQRVSYLEAGVRSGGLLSIAAGLWLRERWVWWAAVAATSLLGIVSVVIWGIGFVRGTIGDPLPQRSIPYVIVGKLFFVFVLALLLAPSTRRSFARPAA